MVLDLHLGLHSDLEFWVNGFWKTTSWGTLREGVLWSIDLIFVWFADKSRRGGVHLGSLDCFGNSRQGGDCWVSYLGLWLEFAPRWRLLGFGGTNSREELEIG